jgi:hypothetical protein
MDISFSPEPIPPEELGDLKDKRIDLAVRIIKQMRDSMENLLYLLDGGKVRTAEKVFLSFEEQKQEQDVCVAEETGVRVLEGVFDGQRMVASDGCWYDVPENYASKSKLVEGDLMKLTIQSDGSFVYKSIAPMERRRLVGQLVFDEKKGGYAVLCPEGERFHVLTASVKFHRIEEGDRVVILVPKDAPSTWGAVENVVKN